MRITRIVIPFLVVAGCAAPARGRTVAPGADFTLARGETVDVEGAGVRVRVRGIPSDSRCPAEVACAWEGDATVRVEVWARGEAKRGHDLHTSEQGGARSMDVGGYVLELRGLEPEPRAEEPIATEDYRVTLRVSRAGS